MLNEIENAIFAQAYAHTLNMLQMQIASQLIIKI